MASMSLHELTNPPSDVITTVRFSPDSSLLLVSAWDMSISLYGRHPDDPTGAFTHLHTLETDAPVLDICWSAGNDTFFSVGLDEDVNVYRISADGGDGRIGRVGSLSTHEKPSNKVAFSKEHNMLVSISWDETMHVHDVESGQYVPIKLAAKPFAIALSADKAVISMVERRVHVYALADLRQLVEQQPAETDEDQPPLEVKPWQERESSLKFMTRASGCMPDGCGFASSSIEGRVGVEWFDEEANKKAYAFKCHREKTTTRNEDGQDVPLDIIYPVNGLAFHPVHGTFATGGGDGVVALWDANTKRRIRQYPKLCSAVASLDFSADGRKLAIGVSPGFEDSKMEELPDPKLVKVYIRDLSEGEAKGKPAKEK